MAIKCTVIRDVTKKIKRVLSLLLYLFEEKCGRLSLKLEITLLDFVTICIGIPCTLKYFIVTTIHIVHSHCVIAVRTPDVTQLKYLVNAYADDTNKLWTIDVTATLQS